MFSYKPGFLAYLYCADKLRSSDLLIALREIGRATNVYEYRPVILWRAISIKGLKEWTVVLACAASAAATWRAAMTGGATALYGLSLTCVMWTLLSIWLANGATRVEPYSVPIGPAALRHWISLRVPPHSVIRASAALSGVYLLVWASRWFV